MFTRTKLRKLDDRIADAERHTDRLYDKLNETLPVPFPYDGSSPAYNQAAMWIEQHRTYLQGLREARDIIAS